MLRLPPVYPRGMEDGQTEGANMAKTAAKLGGIPGYGLCFAAGGVGIIPIVVPITKDLLCTIHLQLLSDRNFGRTLQLGHCILAPASCFTFAT